MSPSQPDQDSLLDLIHVQKLEDRHCQRLEQAITTEEVSQVIQNLKSRSAPGLDGFSVTYYKTFANVLSPYLPRFFKALRWGAPLDTFLNSAYISVIRKPGKDTSSLSNYRPISLINNDLKILTKILADRMASFIWLYIHKDRVGFIPGLQGPDQICRAIDIISLLHSQLSLDLQKAFDSVSWLYRFSILKRWGFGETFFNIINALYSTPEAQIRLQGFYSGFFGIKRH